MNQKLPPRQLQFIQCQGKGDDHGFTLKKNSERKSEQGGHFDLRLPEGKFLTYGMTLEQYLKSGEYDAKLLKSSLVHHGVCPETGPGNILELGCSNARVLRWFSDWSHHGEAWGVDLDAPMIFWCHKNLSPPFHFAVSTSAPHLFFEDRFFSLIFCMSIFTHIDDLYLSWIAELRRITDVGGFVYITINDENARRLQDERNASNLQKRKNSEAFQDFIETEADFVTCGRDWDSLVSFKRFYFLDHVSRYFEIVDVIEGAMAQAQTGVLLKRN